MEIKTEPKGKFSVNDFNWQTLNVNLLYTSANSHKLLRESEHQMGFFPLQLSQFDASQLIWTTFFNRNYFAR